MHKPSVAETRFAARFSKIGAIESQATPHGAKILALVTDCAFGLRPCKNVSNLATVTGMRKGLERHGARDSCCLWTCMSPRCLNQNVTITISQCWGDDDDDDDDDVTNVGLVATGRDPRDWHRFNIAMGAGTGRGED